MIDGHGRILFIFVLLIAVAGVLCVMHNSNVPLFGWLP